MTKDECIKALRNHNRWRRGDDDFEMTNPKLLGVALDTAIEMLEGVDTNVEQVREKLLQRSLVGLSKYGVTTERTDLSDLQWLVHLHEEILDASVYLQRIINAQSHTNTPA